MGRLQNMALKDTKHNPPYLFCKHSYAYFPPFSPRFDVKIITPTENKERKTIRILGGREHVKIILLANHNHAGFLIVLY